MELKVKNIKGEETGNKVTLADSVFGIEPKDHAIYLDVKQYLAAQRQGTHKAKQRNEIAGSTKKVQVVLVLVLSNLHYLLVVDVYLDHNHVTMTLN